MAATAVTADSEALARCAWLAAEALQIEGRAKELDRGGGSAEACLHYRRCIARLAEAIAMCPAGHPDRPTLEDHVQDLSLRTVYLESLGGSLATSPVEEHIEDVILTMDLSSAPRPPEEEIPALLVAGMGTKASASTAPLTEDGYVLIAALRSDVEMEVFVRRVLMADGHKVQEGAEAELAAFLPRYSGMESVQSFARLQQELQDVSWVELSLDPNKDRLQQAVDIENEAQSLESRGRKLAAQKMYMRAAVMFQQFLKQDARGQNPKVKEMVEQRIKAVIGQVEVIKAEVILSGKA